MFIKPVNNTDGNVAAEKQTASETLPMDIGTATETLQSCGATGKGEVAVLSSQVGSYTNK